METFESDDDMPDDEVLDNPELDKNKRLETEEKENTPDTKASKDKEEERIQAEL